jgi:hypothetical protein
MKFFNAFIFLLLFFVQANAQHNHFIYIEAENKQPFYIRMNEKIFSASSSGYVILPKLQAGTYKLAIGFPKKEWPIQMIDVAVNKDAGYILKNFESKGWGLFNMETMDLMMLSGGAANATVKENIPANKPDAFSDLLAETVNAPAIRQQVISSDTIAASKVDTIKEQQQEEVKKKEANPESAKPPRNRIFSNLDQSGRSMIFIVGNDNTMDTVRIFIPYDSVVKTAEAIATPEKKEEIKENNDLPVITITDSGRKTDSVVVKAIPGTTGVSQPANTAIINTIVKEVKPEDKNSYTVSTANPDCKSYATDEDFLKLRKKMASAGNDDDMIAAAKKGFRSKCYSTLQVKNLSLLFLADEGKYNFYDAAYHHVSDADNFKSLETQLSETYYINRFKAMLR